MGPTNYPWALAVTASAQGGILHEGRRSTILAAPHCKSWIPLPLGLRQGQASPGMTLEMRTVGQRRGPLVTICSRGIDVVARRAEIDVVARRAEDVDDTLTSDASSAGSRGCYGFRASVAHSSSDGGISQRGFRRGGLLTTRPSAS
jgi:hypothetical protein